MSKAVLKLSSPIKVNGETIKELEYDVQKLTVLDIMTASRNRAKALGNMDVSQKVAELDTELHFFVGMQAIIKQKPSIDVTDLNNLGGSDAYKLMQIGRSFFKADSLEEESTYSEEQ
jgi:hypothetical protein